MAQELDFVLKMVDAGKTIKFYRDYYGRQKVEIRTAWIWRRQVPLGDHEIMIVREALQIRRRLREASSHKQMQTKQA